MKSTLIGLLAVGLVSLTGCDQGTPGGPGASNRVERKPVLEPSGPGATKRIERQPVGDRANDTFARKPVGDRANDTFTLGVPTLGISLKQGEAKVASISMKRGPVFDEDVTLSFSGAPKGVSVEPSGPVVKNSDKEAKITIKAADDAAIGDFTIKVMGHPSRGPDAVNEFKVTVHKK